MKISKSYIFPDHYLCKNLAGSGIEWDGPPNCEVYKKYPVGKLINALYGRDPRNWETGKLKPEIRTMLKKRFFSDSLRSRKLNWSSNFDIESADWTWEKEIKENNKRLWLICRTLGCEQCIDHFFKDGFPDVCLREGCGDLSPISCDKCSFNDACSILNNPLHSLTDINLISLWAAQTPRVQRAILMILLFGKKGMRPGGYIQADIQRMSGEHRRSGASEVVDKLVEIGMLIPEPSSIKKNAGRKPRYLVEFRTDQKKLHRSIDEAMRRKSIKTICEMNKRLIKRGASFKKDKEYFLTKAGLFIGDIPPRWISYIIEEINEIYEIVFEEMVEPVSRAGHPSASPEIQKHRRSATEEIKHMRSEEFKIRLRNEISESIENILKIPDSLTYADAVEGDEYFESLGPLIQILH